MWWILKLLTSSIQNSISNLSVYDQSGFLVFPSGEVQVYLWMFRCRKIVLLTTRFFDVAKFTILTPLSLLSSCRPAFPVVGLKIFSLPTFALKSPNIIFLWYLGKWFKKPALIPHKNSIFTISFLVTCCMHIQNDDITPATSQKSIGYPITNKLYSHNCWYFFVVYKKSSSQFMIFVTFSIEKVIIFCSYCASIVTPNLLHTH